MHQQDRLSGATPGDATKDHPLAVFDFFGAVFVNKRLQYKSGFR